MGLNEVILVVLSGLISSTAMVVFLELVHGFRFAKADMIRAIGSLMTHDRSTAFAPGLFIHYASGVLFAFLYAGIGVLAFGSGIIVPDFFIVLSVMTLVGLFHGMVVTMSLVIAVAEYHPLEEYRNAGIGVAVSHLFAHVIYGFFIGLCFALSDLSFRSVLG